MRMIRIQWRTADGRSGIVRIPAFEERAYRAHLRMTLGARLIEWKRTE